VPNNILIRDGKAESAAPYEDLPSLEAFLASNTEDRLHLSNDVDLSEIELRLSNIKTISIDFPSFADGRGFSIARDCYGALDT